MKKVNRIIKNCLFYGIVFLLVLYIVTTTFTRGNNIGFVGFRTYSIVSESMVPKIKKGDLIIVKKAKNTREIAQDTIITFVAHLDTNDGKSTEAIVTHYMRYQVIVNGQMIYLTQGLRSNKPITSDFNPYYAKDVYYLEGENYLPIQVEDNVADYDYEKAYYYLKDDTYTLLEKKNGLLFLPGGVTQVTQFDVFMNRTGSVSVQDVITPEDIIGVYAMRIPWVGTIATFFGNIHPIFLLLIVVNGVIIYFIIVIAFKKEPKDVETTDRGDEETLLHSNDGKDPSKDEGNNGIS